MNEVNIFLLKLLHGYTVLRLELLVLLFIFHRRIGLKTALLLHFFVFAEDLFFSILKGFQLNKKLLVVLYEILFVEFVLIDLLFKI
jgi:hypothetical protein